MTYSNSKDIFRSAVFVLVLVSTTQVGRSQDPVEAKSAVAQMNRFFAESDCQAKKNNLVAINFFADITKIHSKIRGDADLELMMIAKTMKFSNQFCQRISGLEGGFAKYGEDKFCTFLDTLLAKASSKQVIQAFFHSANENVEFVARTMLVSMGRPLEKSAIDEAKKTMLDIFEEQEGYGLQQFSSASDKSSLTSR